MKQARLIAATLLALVITIGCSSLYQSTVTLTAAVDSAAKEYAKSYNDGLVTAAVDARVEAGHFKYREAAGGAKEALIAYKLSGDQTQYLEAFNAARAAANAFLQLILPLIDAGQAREIQTNIAKANTI